MYSELDKSQFPRVNSFLEGVSAYLSLPAIIQGISSGRIWIDSSDPRVVLVWDRANGFLFVLSKRNMNMDELENSFNINIFLKETLIPIARNSGYTNIYIFIFSEVIEHYSDELFRNLPFKTKNICHFYLDSKNIGEITIPPAFQVVRIDAEILNNERIINILEVKRCIEACWDNLEDYFEKGIGYALLTENTVVSWCSTDYVVSNACDVYVETFDGYEKKGFGTIVASACVKECLNQNYEVNWHCWHDNTGSTRLAEKIGFSKKAIQRVYIITL